MPSLWTLFPFPRYPHIPGLCFNSYHSWHVRPLATSERTITTCVPMSSYSRFFDPRFPSVYLCLHPLSYLHSEPVSYPRLGGCYSHFNWMPVARRLLSILNLILVSAFTTSVGFQVHKKCYNTLSICKLELRSNSFFAYINDVVLVSNLKCSRYFTGLHVLYSHVSNLPNELQELR